MIEDDLIVMFGDIIIKMKQQVFQSGSKAESPSEINIQKYMEGEQVNQSWQLPCSSITLFILLGFIFILIGIASLVSNYQQNFVQIDLVQKGLTLSTVSTYLSFSSDNTLEVYLKIQKLTQFDYFISQADKQSDFFLPNADICRNYKYNKDLNKTIAVDGSNLTSQDYAFPCGLFPGMFPLGVISFSINNNTNITLDQTDLTYFAYEPDFQNTNQSKGWINTSDPFFKEWMTQNAVITTRKLIGRLNGNFQGYFNMTIQLINELPMPLGKASIILSTTKAFGSSDLPFCVANFCQSGLLFIFAFIVYFYNKLLNERIKNSKMEAQLEIKSQVEQVSVRTGDI